MGDPFEPFLSVLANPAVRPRVARAESNDALRLVMQVLDEIDYGLVVIDASAAVRLANSAALAESTGAGAIRLTGGVLRMRLEPDQDDFIEALAAAQRGFRSLLQLAASRPAQTVAVVPLSEGASATTLLVFGKAKTCAPLSVAFYCRSHGLSSAERSVLEALCAGLKPGEIADRAGVALSTVRSQLGSIRHKTRTRNIRELVCRVASLPPMVPALRGVGSCSFPGVQTLAS